jgi:hypothetical protein
MDRAESGVAMTKELLVGRKAICTFLGRSWDTVHRWIEEDGLPAAKIDGCWEAMVSDLISWKREMIRRQTCQEQKMGDMRR